MLYACIFYIPFFFPPTKTCGMKRFCWFWLLAAINKKTPSQKAFSAAED
jgi:hypothetical protein